MAETPQWRREVQASRMPRGGSGMLPLELTAVAPEIELGKTVMPFTFPANT